jgi:opacity protein-like surface antigen
MTKTLIAAVSALALSFGIAAAAVPQGYGQQSQTGAYAAGSEYSSTPMHDGGR